MRDRLHAIPLLLSSIPYGEGDVRAASYCELRVLALRRQVTSEQLGLYVSIHLRAVHQVAYVRFMAVYRQFADVAEFINAIDDARELEAEDIPTQQALFGQ